MVSQIGMMARTIVTFVICSAVKKVAPSRSWTNGIVVPTYPAKNACAQCQIAGLKNMAIAICSLRR